MKQLLIISGKGGTGKTFFTSCLAVVFENKIIVDCDVDAANLHLLLCPQIKEKYEFWCGKIAEINSEKCIGCGSCKEVCRFSAIVESNGFYKIDPYACEGCTICSYFCEQGAILIKDKLSGYYFISDTEYGPLIHAKLGIAQENSGKLVTKLKEVASEMAKKEGYKYIIIDGPPGVGCPVIASMTGVDLAIAITEPTFSALHDLERIIKLTKHFKVDLKVIINKYDLNEKVGKAIEEILMKEKIELLGRIPFSEEIAASIKQGVPLLKVSKSSLTKIIVNLCQKVIELLK